jgi:hypothetical protein
MATRKKPNPKRIVYLLGAGATQAEVDYLGARPVNLLMRNTDREGVATRVLNGLNARWRLFLGEDEGIDIEKLISLLSASGVDSLSRVAERLRKEYFWDIRNHLVEAQIIDRPKLGRGLLEMHRSDHFKKNIETLSGVLTTNHDGLLQIASQEVFGEINLGFPFESDDGLKSATGANTPPILALHGSFTWKFAVPMKVSRLTKRSPYSADTGWIPPTILKESKNYPFNKIAALAYELLVKKCDVLRIIGSSLTQNDWNVLSLIFNAQRHRQITRNLPFQVQLIMSHQTGLNISQQCSYLKELTPIGFLTDGKFARYKNKSIPPEMKNVFAYWLKEKIYHHRKRGEFGLGDLTPTMAEIAGGIP